MKTANNEEMYQFNFEKSGDTCQKQTPSICAQAQGTDITTPGGGEWNERHKGRQHQAGNNYIQPSTKLMAKHKNIYKTIPTEISRILIHVQVRVANTNKYIQQPSTHISSSRVDHESLFHSDILCLPLQQKQMF